MPKLLDYIMPAYNALKAIDPSLPRALFVALVFLTVLGWRKISPDTWKAFSSVIPVSDEDTSWFKATMLKVWQALPSALLGAVYGALGTGGNVVESLKLAALALFAPVIHEVAWRYQGNLGTKKNPPPSDDKPGQRISFVKPDEPGEDLPPAAMRALACACLLLIGCGSHVNWPKLGACAEPLRPGLVQVVADVLAGNGDVENDLATLGEAEGLGVVECAVEQLVGDLGSAPVTARASRQVQRGRAFLAKVKQ